MSATGFIRAMKDWGGFTTDLFKTYNLLIAIITLVLIGYCYFLKVSPKDKNFKFGDFRKILIEVVVAIGIGITIKLAKVDGLIKILDLYMSLIFVLFFFFLILLIKEVVSHNKSIDKIVAGYSRGYIFLGIIYLISTFATNKFKIANDIALILYFIVFWMILQLLINNSEKNEKGHVDIEIDEDSDTAISSEKQLLPTRKVELNRLYKQLETIYYNEPFALTINGDWGEGKTSFVNVLSNKLAKKSNYIIFIQPMVLDNSEKQMDYLFNQLKIILSNNGIYTGNGSPFKQYFTLISQLINTKPLLQLEGFFSIFEEEVPSDFRTKKQLLEEDILKLLNSNVKVGDKVKNKIYIIIDDFDRVEQETMYNTLVFIKELVNFSGINVIFLMDERKLDAESQSKINKEYLDKFVNSKIHLSRIQASEIFSHFLKNVKVEQFKTHYIKELVRNLEGNVKVQIEQIKSVTNKSIENINKTIDDLSSNNEAQQHAEVQRIKRERHQELQSQKNELSYMLERFDSGITNLRKAKKIVRVIKEILVYCDDQKDKNNYPLFEENLRKVEIHNVIINLAILKVLYGEYIDEIIKTNDIRDFLNRTNDDFLSILFEDLAKGFNTENRELLAEIINSFCNSIILNQNFDNELFTEMRTDSAGKLHVLDSSQHLEINENHFEVVQEYLKAITFNTWDVPNDKLSARLNKLVEYIFELYENGNLTFKNLFELLTNPHRNLLISHSYYYEKLTYLLQQDVIFESENDKTRCVLLLKDIEMHLLSIYKGHIINFISILKAPDGRYTLDNFYADLGGIIRLDGMIEAIKNIFNVEGNVLHGIEFLKEWKESSSISIQEDYSDNEYYLTAIEEFDVLLEEFIELYTYWEEVKFKLKTVSVNHQSKFNERIEISTIQELEFNINEFYQNINLANNIEKQIEYFHFLLIELERYTRIETIKEEIIIKIEEIYNKINKEDLNNISENVQNWLLCTVRMGEIKENQKRIIQKLSEE
ncbi:P-loop NTPase fold protein [Niallia taxi]|uniref:P-loop NTPase fold protein n=1 Tax=Niallia taxi TaxID=2499688 RepID=UPI00317CF9E0